MMHEEMVKRLRDYEESGLCAITPYEAGTIADAIEELSVEIEKLKKKVRSLQNKVDSLKSAASWDEDIRRGQVQGMW